MLDAEMYDGNEGSANGVLHNSWVKDMKGFLQLHPLGHVLQAVPAGAWGGFGKRASHSFRTTRGPNPHPLVAPQRF